MSDAYLWAVWPFVCIGAAYVLDRIPGSRDAVDWFGGPPEEPFVPEVATSPDPADQLRPAVPETAGTDGATAPLLLDGANPS